MAGSDFNNLIWPTRVIYKIQGFDVSNKIINWNIHLKCINPAHSFSLKPFEALDLDKSWFDQPSLSNRL